MGIPLPGSGMDAFIKGFGFDDNLMQQLLQRKQLAQQMKVHQDSLAMQRAQQGRLNRSADDAHKLAMMKLDPNYEVNQLKRMMEAFGGKKEPTEQESFIPGIAMGANENPMGGDVWPRKCYAYH